MGFLPQINEILEFVPESHQTLLFSATLPPAIQRMAETRLDTPEFVTLSGDHVGALEIDHFVYMSYGDKTADFLAALELENPESAVIFCNTREQTKRLATFLTDRGYAADWLNADLSQADREKVMAATRNGQLRLLVATDVAARGIDISHLTHVINFDLPESAEVYVHRTGRTGRAGRTGTAVSMIAPSDVGNLYLLRLTYKIRPIEKPLPTEQAQKTHAETAVVASLVELFASRHPNSDDLSLARRLLTHDSAETVVAGLLRDHLGDRPDVAAEAVAKRRAKLPAPVADPPSSATGDAAGRSPAERRRRRRAASETADPAATTEDDDSRTPARPSRQRRPSRLSSPQTSETQTRVDATDAPAPELPASEPGPVSDEPHPDAAALAKTAEIYIDVGRSDGANPDDFLGLLETRANIGRDVPSYVRVRPRHTFVALPSDLLEPALSALDGATIAGRTIHAEKARAR